MSDVQAPVAAPALLHARAPRFYVVIGIGAGADSRFELQGVFTRDEDAIALVAALENDANFTPGTAYSDTATLDQIKDMLLTERLGALAKSIEQLVAPRPNATLLKAAVEFLENDQARDLLGLYRFRVGPTWSRGASWPSACALSCRRRRDSPWPRPSRRACA